MRSYHYFIAAFVVMVVVGFLFLRGCVHCTGRALSGPAPTQTVYVAPNPAR